MAKVKFFDSLITSWQESLKIFSPKAFLQFGYIIVNSLIYMLFDLWKASRVLVLILLLCLIGLISNAAFYNFINKFFSIPFILIYTLILNIYSYLIIMALRPSVMLKDRKYLWLYSFRSLGYFGILHISLFFVDYCCINMELKLPAYNFFSITAISDFIKGFLAFIFFLPKPILNFEFITILFLSPLLIIPYLFLLDAKPNLVDFMLALFRGLKMIIYNYPYFLIIYGVARLILNLLDIAFAFSQQLSINPLELYFAIIIILPIFYSCMVNFYVKRMHEQFDLYYH